MNLVRKIVEYLTHPRKIIIFFNCLGCGKLFPDKFYLKCLYRDKLSKKLNLRNPQTFNEKLQWLKLYDRKPEYTMMVDKYAVKSYVAEKIGEEYIIPTLGVWDRFEDIDFDALPDQFVLKCTHDSGGLVICRDKRKFDREAARKQICRALKRNYFWHGREWPYKNVKPRIIAEQYMEDSSGNGLRDYKFYCFGGVPKFLYISEGLENHATASISFLNLDWTFAPFQRKDYKNFVSLPDKPTCFGKMLKLAEELSRVCSFLRVDLYEIDGKIYFSELTFTPCSGMIPFTSEEWDKILGSWIELPGK